MVWISSVLSTQKQVLASVLALVEVACEKIL